MDILSNLYTESSVNELSIILNNLYHGNKTISYDEFQKLIINFGLKVMETYLKSNNLSISEFSFKIVKENNNLGSYSLKKNEIQISDVEIKLLYQGYLLNLFSIIFHELNHFKINCDLLRGTYSFDLLGILKEKILATNLKGYYINNYAVFKEEIYVELLSIQDFFNFLNYFQLKLTKLDYEVLEKYLSRLKEDYNNDIRNLTYQKEISRDYLTYNELFDWFISKNPIYLTEYPILKIEYYLKDGEVFKRTIDELVVLYSKENDCDKRKLIKEIIISNSRNMLNKLKTKK